MTTDLLTRVRCAPDLDARIASVSVADELTRRGLITGGLGAAVALGLTGCGDDSSTSDDKADDAGGAKTATRRRVSTIHGTVEVPLNPQRIVAFDFPEACALLDLGVAPVGRPSYMPAFAPYTTALHQVPAIDEASTGDLVLEKIAALTPDLILGDDWADPQQQHQPYSKLAAIAPTAIFAWQQAAGNWPALAAQTAAAIGKTADLNTLKHRYAAKAASIQHTDRSLFARTRWDLIDCGKDYWDLYSASSSHGHVLTGAGVRLGVGATQKTGYKQYSLEQLGMLAHTDVIVTTPVSLPFLHKQALFEGLPAVRAGHVYTTDLFFPASYGIALALLDGLTRICDQLAG
ncbi:MAG: ABC transporter substrate-binding protein [Nocardioides sp.]